MSGGTLISLAADEIVVDEHSVLGPVDPQLDRYPAASLVAVAGMPGDHDDQTLIMADVGRKAIAQVEGFVARMLARRLPPERGSEVGAADGHRRLDAGPSADRHGTGADGTHPPGRDSERGAPADGALSPAARSYAGRRVRPRPVGATAAAARAAAQRPPLNAGLPRPGSGLPTG